MKSSTLRHHPLTTNDVLSIEYFCSHLDPAESSLKENKITNGDDSKNEISAQLRRIVHGK
jgi:hypothetical protein